MSKFKKRLLVIALSTILANVTFAQSGGGTTNSFKPSPDFLAKMEKVLPNAPTTASIGQFGGVDIALNTGTVKKSVDLKPFTARKLSVPLQLRYNSMGLRVNEYATKVGMGWHLLVGGVISRVIYGKDDLVATRYTPSFTMTPNEEDPQTTNYCYNLTHTGNKDASPDVFTYNFGTYSGKFILDENKNILPIEITNIKFSYNASPSVPWKFKAITPEGTEYYFGEPGSIESSKLGSSFLFNSFTPNAWYISRITNQFGSYINFTYTEINTGGVTRDFVESQVKNDPQCALTCPGDPESTPNGCMSYYSQYFSQSEKTPQLVQITNDDGDKVVFQYSSTIGLPEKVITQIKYYINPDVLTSKYEFSYNSVQSTPFLNNIKEKAPNDQPLSNGYTFSYYSPELTPQRFSKSQDHWGFFNNAINSTLIPVPDDMMYQEYFPDATADRNPNPAYAVVGMLKNISYPTGGSDEIEYEPNTFTETKDINGYTTTVQSIDGNSETAYRYSPFDYFSIGYDPMIKVTIWCEYTDPNAMSPHPGGKVTITNTATGQVAAEYFISPPVPPAGGSSMDVKFITLAPGNYSIRTGTQGISVRTTSSLKRRDGLTANNQTVQTVIGGMRVKRVTTSANSGAPNIVKRYYYGTLANKEQSSAQYYTKPKYLVTDFKFTDGVVDGLCSGLTCYHTFHHAVMQYTALDKLFLNDGNITEYTSVLESTGGDNFENGAVEHKFNVAADIPSQSIRGEINNVVSPYTNLSIYGLAETETNIYKRNSNNTLTKIKTNIYENYVDNRLGDANPYYFVNETGNLFCASFNGSQVVGPYPVIHSIFTINRYNIDRAWKYLKMEKTIQYDENGANPITTQIDYVYDDLQHLNLTQRKFTNSKGQLLVENFTYPNQYAGQQPYTEMINRNMLTPVIEQTYNNTSTATEISKVKTNYQAWNNSQFILPATVEKALNGTALQVEFTINDYDEKGNIKQTTDKAGIVTAYIWGYGKKYGVAKIAGKSYADAVSQSGISQAVLDNPATTEAQMRTELNKLRTLNGCLVSSFTYKEPMGITSETDANGRNTFYEYDAFNRLVLIRDNENNILKKICYNYTGQVENCTSPCVVTTADWQNTTTPPTCQLDICGNNTGYQLQEQKDMNPCSPTYNQLQTVPVYNPAACVVSSNGNTLIYFDNSMNIPGFTAVYESFSTGQQYSFNIPNGTGTLGCIPLGLYRVTISKPGNSIYMTFGTGCQTTTGTSAYFGKVNVNIHACRTAFISAAE